MTTNQTARERDPTGKDAHEPVDRLRIDDEGKIWVRLLMDPGYLSAPAWYCPATSEVSMQPRGKKPTTQAPHLSAMEPAAPDAAKEQIRPALPEFADQMHALGWVMDPASRIVGGMARFVRRDSLKNEQ